MILPRRFTEKQYRKWIKDPRSKEASLDSFFPTGIKRTINVLRKTATEKSIVRWRSFGARHYAQYLNKPTYKRAIALRNWGFNVRVPKKT